MAKRCLAVAATLTLAVGLFSTHWLTGTQAPADNAAMADEKLIRTCMEDFVKAFNEGDAQRMAAALTPDVEFIDENGTGLHGRQELQNFYADFLARNKGAKLALTLDGVRVVAANVALEDGESIVTIPDQATQSARRYAMVFAKTDGKWLLGSIREFPNADEPLAASEQLQDLEWLMGDWVDEGADSAVSIKCHCADDKSCFMRDFEIKVKGEAVRTGTQRIGVDPLTGQIKGWAFDSDGGYGETVWIRHGEEWLVKATGVSSQGEASSATYVIRPLGKDQVSWKTMHRVVGNDVQPDLEVTMVRRPPQPK